MVATSLFAGQAPPNLKLITHEILILTAIQEVLECRVKKNNYFLGLSVDNLLAAGHQAIGIRVVFNHNVNSIINNNMRTMRLRHEPSVSIRKK